MLRDQTAPRKSPQSPVNEGAGKTVEGPPNGASVVPVVARTSSLLRNADRGAYATSQPPITSTAADQRSGTEIFWLVGRVIVSEAASFSITSVS